MKGHGVYGHGVQEKLMDQHEEFLSALAAHPIWYKDVVRMVQQYQGNMLHTGCSGSLLLSQFLCGAKCLQDSLPHLPRELQQNLVHTYSDLTSYNQAVEHTTVLTTYSVLMVFLPAFARLCQFEAAGICPWAWPCLTCGSSLPHRASGSCLLC